MEVNKQSLKEEVMLSQILPQDSALLDFIKGKSPELAGETVKMHDHIYTQINKNTLKSNVILFLFFIIGIIFSMKSCLQAIFKYITQ